MRKLLPTLTRGLVALAATGALVAAGAGTAVAQEPAPPPPVGIHVTAGADSVDYTISNVPRVPVWGPITSPGACTTTLVDAVKAAPIVGPSVVDVILGNPVDYVDILQQLLEGGAVVDTKLLLLANSTGVIDSAFTDVPAGVYAVATICNLNSDNFAVGAAWVIGDIWPPGISTGSVEDAIGGGA